MDLGHFKFCFLGGPYTGIGGIGYALLRVARIQPNEFKACLENCNRLIEYQLPYAKVLWPFT